MPFRTISHLGGRPFPLTAACVTWLPIGIGIVLGTLARGATYVFGGGDFSALAISVGFVLGGGIIALLWSADALPTQNWVDLIKISFCWLSMSAAFRALWLGALLGGGRTGVIDDLKIWETRPGLLILVLTALAPWFLPVLARGRARWDQPTDTASGDRPSIRNRVK